MKAIVQAICFTALSAGISVAAEPLEVLRAATAEIVQEIKATTPEAAPLVDRLKPIFVRDFDFALLARRAVGPHWRNFSPEQRQETTDLLANLVVRTYATRFDPTIPFTINYGTPIVLSAERCEIPTVLARADRSFAISYRAERSADGWRFYDVIVEGVSLVANYRAQFDPLYLRGGAGAVTDALRQKLAANSFSP